MNVLFDIGHPAHFHLFKNLVKELRKNNHSVLLAVRDKDVLVSLLERDGFSYYLLSRAGKGFLGLALELLVRDVKMYYACRNFRPDLLIGSSVSIAHVGKLMGIPSLVFSEDDDPVVPLFAYLTYPFAYRIVNPACVKYHHWKAKRLLHRSYHELAYLHPNNFTPDRDILEKYNLKEKSYIVARFSALQAHHDVGESGLPVNTWIKIERLVQGHGYQVIKSVENERSHMIDPWDIHHVLSFAKMLVSDSQTMTAEAAVLGVPAVRINSFVGRIGYLDELENSYRLAIGLLPYQEDEILKTIDSILKDPSTDKTWEGKRKIMLSEKQDLNQWMIGLIGKFL